MTGAHDLFTDVLHGFRTSYHTYTFFMERDIVWTLHLRLLQLIEERQLPYTVSYNVPMGAGALADLVILDENNAIASAIEVKYEPAHTRRDIPKSKLPVVFWTGPGSVARDVERAQRFVADGRARAAYSIFVDEGSSFRTRPALPGSRWIDWGACGRYPVAVLWFEVGENAPT